MIEVPIRQSWLGTFSNCPEWARNVRYGLVRERETSDMLRGNMVHAAIEYCGNELMSSGVRPPLDEAIDHMDAVFHELCGSVEGWRHELEEIVDVARANLTVWYEDLFPSLNPVAVEKHFRVPLDERDGVRVVLEGTADWVEDGVIYDWKNPSRSYEPWEKQRWDIQSHVYCAAFDCPKFRLVALVKGKMQIIEIERRVPHLEALKDLCWSIVELLQSDLKVWPQRWAGWHCSPKWCPVWQAGECRGKHLGPTPW